MFSHFQKSAHKRAKKTYTSKLIFGSCRRKLLPEFQRTELEDMCLPRPRQSVFLAPGALGSFGPTLGRRSRQQSGGPQCPTDIKARHRAAKRRKQ